MKEPYSNFLNTLYVANDFWASEYTTFESVVLKPLGMTIAFCVLKANEEEDIEAELHISTLPFNINLEFALLNYTSCYIRI